MKGTEKQVKWAQDIIQSARDTIANNIRVNDERLAQYPEMPGYMMSAKIWRKVNDEYEAALTKIADKDAAYIINIRLRMDGDAVHKRATDLHFWYEKHPETIERDLSQY